MVVRKEVCLTQSEWYVMDCLWAYAPQTVMQLATDLSQRAGWAQEHHHHHSGADGGQGTGPQHTRGPGQAVSPMCAAGGGSKVGGLLLPGLYLSGECGADGVHHGGWQAGHTTAGGPAGEGGPPPKSRSGRSGGAPDAGGGARLRGRSPLPIQLRRVCGSRGGRSPIHLTAPPVSSAGYPPIEEEGALEEARSLLLQAVEYDDSRDATAFGFSDMAPYSYQLALSMREDWMYFYLYPSSNGPVYVLPYLDGRPAGPSPWPPCPAAPFLSSSVSQLSLPRFRPRMTCSPPSGRPTLSSAARGALTAALRPSSPPQRPGHSWSPSFPAVGTPPIP